MRSFAIWTVWSLLIILVAITTPEWFPAWLQGGIWGFGVGAGIASGISIRQISFLRDRLVREEKENDRLRGTNKELENKLQAEQDRVVTGAQATYLPKIRLEETSAQQQPTPKLLAPSLPISDLSNSQLKNKTFGVVNKIRIILSDIEAKTKPIELRINELYNTETHRGIPFKLINPSDYFINDPFDLKSIDIEITKLDNSRKIKKAEALSEYTKEVGDLPRQLRNEILKRLPEKYKTLPEHKYAIEDIWKTRELANELAKLAAHLPDQ